MKYLFCDNISDKHSDDSREHWAESVYIAEEAPEEWSDGVEEAEKALEKIEGKKPIKAYLPALTRYALFVGVILLLAILYEIAGRGTAITEVYKNLPWLFWISGAGFIVSGIAYLLSRSSIGEESGSRKLKQAQDLVETAEKRVVESLNVPRDAIKADILRFTYEEKEDRLDLLFTGEYSEVDLFDRDGALCLFDGTNIYALPKEEMTSIRVIVKEVLVDGWNKPEPEDSEVFVKKGVKPRMGLRYFCALDLERDGEKLSLLFPAYELGRITELTGLEPPRLPGSKKKGRH